ncbi:helix-turn-helix domain-containing protein [Pandoraea sp. PE-S2T-3]|uniref:helix-turn-helix domain-containing protein n=1 Tax=Pandoraea sp. PE-S2T-3 TaxID=1986993 RepID=UPI0020CD2F46|nr:helix-turn-helix transcriptional regulator [Pandoraea sp. PE-S2T-3]
MQTNPLALFGDHLAHLRKARGWSQEKLALESGLARSYVSGIERGRRNVALVNICVLADTLGVPTSEMLRFSQAIAGTDTSAITAGRTPLPQISRSLGRLENRDQVWLAEIIRSLSSRLSHANVPAAASSIDHGVDPDFDGNLDGHRPTSIAADNDAAYLDEDDEAGEGQVERNRASDRDGERSDIDDDDTVDTLHPPVIEPRFDHRHPTPHQASATAQGYHASGDNAPPRREPDGNRPIVHDVSRDTDHDDAQRSPAVDEE